MGITVAQALEIDGLRRSEIRAGRMGLQRTVEHVLVFNDVPCDAVPAQHDQVLYLTNLVSIPRDPQAQCANIATLSERHSAGLLVQPARAFQLFPEALALADELTFPVIELAADVPYTDIITSVMTALMHEQTATLERQRMFQQQLIDLMLRGFGLEHLVRATAERLRRPVLVLGARNETQASYGLDELQRQQWHDLVARARPARPRILDLSTDTGATVRVSVFPLPGTQRPGWFVTSHDSRFDREQQALVEQAGAILALDLLKQETLIVAQRNRQAELIEQVLSEHFTSEEQLLRAANEIGWDVHCCRALVIVRGPPPEAHERSAMPLRIVADVARHASPANIVCARGDDLLVFASLHGAPQVMRATLRDLTHGIHQALQENGQRQYVVASGSLVESPLSLSASYRAALGALRLRPQLPGAPTMVSYEDTQLLVFLSDFAERSEVRGWLREQIGALLDYDQRNKTTLVQTLEAALDQGGVLTVTAEQLSIHPNTLKYRLQRIEEIIEHNPLSSPHRLAYHIAAKLARLLA